MSPAGAFDEIRSRAAAFRARRRAHVYLGAETTSDDLADWFREIARELDARPRRLALRIHGAEAPGLDAWLDFDPKDGEMVARVAGRGETKFSLRRRWLPEHPVPLRLSRADAPGSVRTLRVDPVDANRFRVRLARGRAARIALARALFAAGFAALALFAFMPGAFFAAAAVLAVAASAFVRTRPEPRE